jgi:hypothetical protein
LPAEKPTEPEADDRRNESVALLVGGDHPHRLVAVEEAVVGDKSL